jgi:hypothetical protein
MECYRCKKKIEENLIFYGSVFPGIVDGQRRFFCAGCINNQPERSKREDLPKWACRAVMMPNGLCHFEDGTIIDSQQPIDEGCGALNSQETD